jgi:hypothetical protein
MIVRWHLRSWLAPVAAFACAWLISPQAATAVAPQAAAPATSACVALGAPKPAVSYIHRYSDTSGSTEYSNQWEQFTATGSRLVTTKLRPTAGVSTYVSRHHVEDDVFVLEASTASGTDAGGPFSNSMTFSSGAIGDPAFRACTGKTWTIAAVGVAHKSMQGSFSARTDPGTLAIAAIHESVTVPAGTFDTVRYIKTMNSGRGQLRDEFWKSIEHGITVKRNSTQPGAIATEVLIAIR